MINKKLVSELAGGLFFLAKSMGDTASDYFFTASVNKLDEGDLIASYMQTLDKNLPADDVINLKNLTEYNSGTRDLESFLSSVFKNRIGNYRDTVDYLLDYILFITDDNCTSIPQFFYMCDFGRSYLCPDIQEERNQSGKILFIPAENEFLVMYFCISGKNSVF